MDHPLRYGIVVAAGLLSSASAMASDAPTVAAVARKAEEGRPVSVVFLGGSLTWGANASDPNATSYRGYMMDWLRKRYPSTPFRFHDAAIGGQGSNLGLFRLGRDVYPCNPDLVFLDFTVNDDISSDDEVRLATYERVVRDMRERGIAVMPVLLSVSGYLSHPIEEPPPARYRAHAKLADAYGLVWADTMRHGRIAVHEGRVNPSTLYPFAGDPTHPDDAGYELFFEAVREAWLKGEKEPLSAPVPEHTVFADLFRRHERVRIPDGTLPTGWSRSKTYRTSMWFDNLSSRWMGDVARAAGPEAEPLVMTFNGSLVGIIGERNPLTVPFRVWIDGLPVAQPKSKADDPFLWNISTASFATDASGAANLFAWTLLAADLKDGSHTLKIAPDFSVARPGADLRLESVCSAGR